MALSDDLERIAAAAAVHGDVAGVLAAEPSSGLRVYVVALGDEDARAWLVLDDAGAPVVGRAEVRAAASIVALSELAAEVAGGGDLEALRARLVQLRIVEAPEGIEAAEAAALALERVIGVAPRVASPGYLDDVGTATRELERTLGDTASPFADALRAGTGVVDEFVREVELRYRLQLR